MASIEEQLKRIVINKVKMANGKTVRQNLIEAVDYLYDCINDEIDNMYEEYEPIKYQRRPHGENLRSSLYAEDFVQARIKDNRIELSLKFSNNVWAWNFDQTHKSPVNILMNEGWRWHVQPEKPVWRFTYYEGYHFIEKGIARFNQSNRWGVVIDTPIIDISKWY